MTRWMMVVVALVMACAGCESEADRDARVTAHRMRQLGACVEEHGLDIAACLPVSLLSLTTTQQALGDQAIEATRPDESVVPDYEAAAAWLEAGR